MHKGASFLIQTIQGMEYEFIFTSLSLFSLPKQFLENSSLIYFLLKYYRETSNGVQTTLSLSLFFFF